MYILVSVGPDVNERNIVSFAAVLQQSDAYINRKEYIVTFNKLQSELLSYGRILFITIWLQLHHNDELFVYLFQIIDYPDFPCVNKCKTY